MIEGGDENKEAEGSTEQTRADIRKAFGAGVIIVYPLTPGETSPASKNKHVNNHMLTFCTLQPTRWKTLKPVVSPRPTLMTKT